jgi:hypothetical protein
VIRPHAHPKWRDDLRLVGECAALFIVIFAACVASSTTPS